ADAYAAMDVFAFSSQSETQGMVLAEAMAAGTPAVALDAPGSREIVSTNNGRLLDADATEDEFALALDDVTADPAQLGRLSDAACRTAETFSIENCASQLLDVYERLIQDYQVDQIEDPGPWDR